MTDFGTVSAAVSLAVISAITERTNQPVTANSRLVEDLGFDSLTILDLTVALEQEFEFQIEYTASRCRPFTTS